MKFINNKKDIKQKVLPILSVCCAILVLLVSLVLSAHDNQVVAEDLALPELKLGVNDELLSSFEEIRPDSPTLPSGWTVQQSGLGGADELCIREDSWFLTKETFSGLEAVKYVPRMDTLSCGLRMSPFTTDKVGNITLEFYYKSNFTNPDTYILLLNYGDDNCQIQFNNKGVIGYAECIPSQKDVGGGWFKVNAVWPTPTPLGGVYLFITPPFGLDDDGTVIIDDVKLTMT